MKICFIKEKYLRQLKGLAKNRQEWLEHCDIQSPWLTKYFGHNKWYGDTGIEIDQNLELSAGGSKGDIENSIKLYELLEDKLTSVQAADPRLWVFLCHETCWDYMVKRWEPKPETDIISRYYLEGTDSRALILNGVARLWWFAYLTYDKNRPDPYELLKILLRDQNIQHNLLERNFGRNRMVLHAVLDFIKSNPDINKKEDYEKIGKIINRWGGVRLLDYLNKKDVTAYLAARYASA
jgi:hypothetical protein